RCFPGSEITWSQPCAYSRNLEPCVVTCGDSRAVVYAPPVVLTLPGPTLNSSSQESIVGASFPQPYGAVTSYGSGIGGSSGSGGFSGSGGSFGYGSSSGLGGSYGSGGSFG
ncbi:KRFJ protein, partial [Urocolius indicus]|nr:KRFJ protein [Urocolius indicus]